MADPGFRRIDSSNAFSAALLNEIPDGIELAQTYQGGRGVLSGMALSDGGGFTLSVSSGVCSNGLKVWEIDAFTSTIPPSVTRYVWYTPGAVSPVSLTATSADPGGTAIPLGKVITNGSEITSVSNDGRVELLRWTDVRTLKIGADDLLVIDELNGRVGVGMVPTVTFEVDGAIKGTSLDVPSLEADVLTVPQSGSAPAAVADTVKVYAKNVGGTAELFARDETGAEIQLTDGGKLKIGAKVVAAPDDDYAITAADAGRIFTNENYTGAHEFTLPPAVAGLGPFSFVYIQGGDMTITPDGTDKMFDAATDERGSVTLDEKMDALEIIGVAAGAWWIRNIRGA